VVFVLVGFGRVSFVGEGRFVAVVALVGVILEAGEILDGRGIEILGEVVLPFGEDGCGGNAIGLLGCRPALPVGEIFAGDVMGAELSSSV
jgi:hypothetical protein